MRGHKVTLFEKSGEIGGQFNLAKNNPRKGGVPRNHSLFQQTIGEIYGYGQTQPRGRSG